MAIPPRATIGLAAVLAGSGVWLLGCQSRTYRVLNDGTTPVQVRTGSAAAPDATLWLEPGAAGSVTTTARKPIAVVPWDPEQNKPASDGALVGYSRDTFEISNKGQAIISTRSTAGGNILLGQNATGGHYDTDQISIDGAVISID